MQFYGYYWIYCVFSTSSKDSSWPLCNKMSKDTKKFVAYFLPKKKKKIQKYMDKIYTRVVGNEWLIIRIERTLLVYYSGRYFLFSIIVVLFNLCFNWYCIVKKNRFCNAESYRYIVFVFNTFTVGRIFIHYVTHILTNPFHLKSIFCMV